MYPQFLYTILECTVDKTCNFASRRVMCTLYLNLINYLPNSAQCVSGIIHMCNLCMFDVSSFTLLNYCLSVLLDFQWTYRPNTWPILYTRSHLVVTSQTHQHITSKSKISDHDSWTNLNLSREKSIIILSCHPPAILTDYIVRPIRYEHWTYHIFQFTS